MPSSKSIVPSGFSKRPKSTTLSSTISLKEFSRASCLTRLGFGVFLLGVLLPIRPLETADGLGQQLLERSLCNSGRYVFNSHSRAGAAFLGVLGGLDGDLREEVTLTCLPSRTASWSSLARRLTGRRRFSIVSYVAPKWVATLLMSTCVLISWRI